MGTAGKSIAESGGNGGVIVGPSIDPATLANGGSDSGSDSGGNGTDEFDPAIHIGRDKRNSDGSYRRKRGRKAGSGSTGKASAGSDLKGAVESLSATLVMLHLGIASATKSSELVIDKEEADLLSRATVNVLEQYDIRPDPKLQAMFGLIVAAGTVYGPRAFLIQKRRADERAAKARNITPDLSAKVADFDAPSVN